MAVRVDVHAGERGDTKEKEKFLQIRTRARKLTTLRWTHNKEYYIPITCKKLRKIVRAWELAVEKFC